MPSEKDFKINEAPKDSNGRRVDLVKLTRSRFVDCIPFQDALDEAAKTLYGWGEDNYRRHLIIAGPHGSGKDVVSDAIAGRCAVLGVDIKPSQVIDGTMSARSTFNGVLTRLNADNIKIFFDDFSERLTTERREREISHRLAAREVKLLIIRNGFLLEQCTNIQRSQIIDGLLGLADRCSLRLVMLMTEATSVIITKRAWAGERFLTVKIGGFKTVDDLVNYLTGWDASVGGLPHGGTMATPEIAKLLLEQTTGTIGQVTDVIKAAMRIAASQAQPIDVAHFQCAITIGEGPFA